MTSGTPSTEAEAIARDELMAQVASVQFDFDAVARALGEVIDDVPAGDVERLCIALDRLFNFIVSPGAITPSKAVSSGRRALAVAWLLWPGRFSGRSLSALARELGTHPAILAETTGDFSRRFGIRFRGQAQSSGVYRPADGAGDHQQQERDPQMHDQKE